MTCRKRVKITRFHKIIGGTRVGGERYGYLDKVLSVTEGERKYTYDYHVDGQLARADYGKGGTRSVASASEDFLWDGLALIRRGDERFVNEPHVGGGNPVASLNGTTYFNDMLGTTVGARTKGRKYTPAALTAFGEDLTLRCQPQPSTSTSFYTGKPEVAGLGHAFLFRNYRAGLAKWQTTDPLGYPDGWNQLAYCSNGAVGAIDLWGAYSKDSMFELTPEQINQVNGSANEISGDYIRDGWSVEYRCDNTLLYYCNETTRSDVSAIYFATGTLVTTTTYVYADIYQSGYFLARMTKSEVLRRCQNASWEVVKGFLGRLGLAISIGEAGADVSLADILNQIEGNEICIRIADTYKCIAKRQLIDQMVDIKWYPIFE